MFVALWILQGTREILFLKLNWHYFISLQEIIAVMLHAKTRNAKMNNELSNLSQKEEKRFPAWCKGRKSSPIRCQGKSIFQQGPYLFACQFVVKAFVEFQINSTAAIFESPEKYFPSCSKCRYRRGYVVSNIRAIYKHVR